ncbi:hypothetical protein [Endozoicomonas atrinae]|uniref:hypothetical protein n=1 Tax=Endozoicomonas atrinae TaxID=1333660 RepID=UPI00082502C1|nr:hypothetical protein [Endozoicomonas atrinae]
MILALVLIVIMLLIFFADALRYGWITTAAKPFWLFSYFFMLSYPIKYLIISYGLPIQAPLEPDMYIIKHALLFSFVFWFMIRVVYASIIKGNACMIIHGQRNDIHISSISSRNDFGVIFLVGLLILLSYYYYCSLLSSVGFELIRVYHGNEQIEARIGEGINFLIGDLYLAGFFIYLFGIQKKRKAISFVVLVLVFSIAFLSSILLTTRRPLYLAFYLLLLYIYLGSKKSGLLALLAVYPVVTSLLAPFAQLFRYSFDKITETGIPSFNVEDTVVSIGSTFEGVEYLSRFLEITKIPEHIGGIDFGVAYAFNSFFALIPRAMWSSKPLVYGSVEIQDYLYSTGYGVTTLPSGIVVDSLYGFGLIGFIFYAVTVAFLLKWIERTIFYKQSASFTSIIVASYLYIYMFNFVRSGTGIIQGVVMLLPWLLAVKFIKKIKI